MMNTFYSSQKSNYPQVNYPPRIIVPKPMSPPRFSVPGPASPSRFTIPRPASPAHIIIPSIPRASYPLQPIIPKPSSPRAHPVSPRTSHRHELLRSDTSLNERQQAFCSCVAKVAAKQPEACLLEKAWFDKRDGYRCANPFPVCASSVGTTTRGCIKEYDYDSMPDVTLRGLAYLHGIPVSQPFNRSALISSFMNKISS